MTYYAQWKSSVTYTYSWNYTSWDACSGSCGGGLGVQTRSATCMRSDGTVAISSLCGGSPSTSQSCTNTNACTVAVIDGECGTASNTGATFTSEPSSSQKCATGTPTVATFTNSVYKWTCNGSWGGSSVTCGAISCTNTNFSNAICQAYKDVWNRGAEWGGFEYWNKSSNWWGSLPTYTDIGKIDSAIYGGGVAKEPSCQTKECKILKAYFDLLNRAADTSGYTYWNTNIPYNDQNLIYDYLYDGAIAGGDPIYSNTPVKATCGYASTITHSKTKDPNLFGQNGMCTPGDATVPVYNSSTNKWSWTCNLYQKKNGTVLNSTTCTAGAY